MRTRSGEVTRGQAVTPPRKHALLLSPLLAVVAAYGAPSRSLLSLTYARPAHAHTSTHVAFHLSVYTVGIKDNARKKATIVNQLRALRTRAATLELEIVKGLQARSSDAKRDFDDLKMIMTTHKTQYRSEVRAVIVCSYLWL